MSAPRTLRIVSVSFMDGDRQVDYFKGDEVDRKHLDRPEMQDALEPLNGDSEPEAEVSQEPITGDYENHTAERLRVEADRRNLTVAGTGANGNVLKADLVDALEAADAGEQPPAS